MLLLNSVEEEAVETNVVVREEEGVAEVATSLNRTRRIKSSYSLKTPTFRIKAINVELRPSRAKITILSKVIAKITPEPRKAVVDLLLSMALVKNSNPSARVSSSTLIEEIPRTKMIEIKSRSITTTRTS